MTALVFDNQSEQMLSVKGNQATLWELNPIETSALVSVSITPGAQIEQVSFDPKGWRFITASSDGTARVWSSDESGLQRVALEDQSARLRDIREQDNARFWLTPGARFMVGAEPSQFQIWDAGTGKVVYQGPHPKDAYLSNVASAHGATGTTVVLGYVQG